MDTFIYRQVHSQYHGKSSNVIHYLYAEISMCGDIFSGKDITKAHIFNKNIEIDIVRDNFLRVGKETKIGSQYGDSIHICEKIPVPNEIKPKNGKQRT